jgi:hypothetical protein
VLGAAPITDNFLYPMRERLGHPGHRHFRAVSQTASLQKSKQTNGFGFILDTPDIKDTKMILTDRPFAALDGILAHDMERPPIVSRRRSQGTTSLRLLARR